MYLKNLLVLLFLALSACNTTPPDAHICTELEINRGFCVTMVTGKGQYVDDKRTLRDPIENKDVTWWDMRPVLLQIPYFDWVQLKKWIMLQCKKTNRCDSVVSSWERSLETMDKIIEEK